MTGKIFITAAALLVITSTAFSQSNRLSKKSKASLTYIKKDKNQVFFLVEVLKFKPGKFFISIVNENGETIQATELKKRKFRSILSAPVEHGRINVLVSDHKDCSVVGYFEISPDHETIDEVLVSKL